MKFKKLVAIEPVSLIPSAEEKLKDYAEEIVMYRDIPADDEEILRRIGDADAVLVSYTSRITRSVIERCQNVRYIGMCCSLYSEESANVDIACARERGIRLMWVSHDLCDPRVFTRSAIRDQVSAYMRTVLREEPLDPSLEHIPDDEAY